MTAILSSDSRDGHWRVPAKLSARSVLGECKIDMQDALLTSHTTVIEARATLGSVEILVPDGGRGAPHGQGDSRREVLDRQAGTGSRCTRDRGASNRDSR